MKKAIFTLAILILSTSMVFTGCKDSKQVNNDYQNTEAAVQTTATVEWEDFLKTYDAWVDRYNEILVNYHDNPTNESIKNDYDKATAELNEINKIHRGIMAVATVD